jgi:hydroxyacyl-ACP dehydratase HTD2-like protein with hotdog domain
MVVERGKIREFARATKSDNPDYLDDDRPLSPVTFLAASAFWQDASNSAWGNGPRNFERILHGEQEFVFFGEPPRAGDVLTGVSRIERVYEKEGRRGGTMTFTEAVTEFRDPDGKLVAESRTTSIETGQAPTSGDAS